jgi:hypothetical protein
MTDFLIPEAVTTQHLREIFERALFDTSIDDDGDLVVQDTYRIFVAPHSRRFIRFFTLFGLKDGTTPEAGHRLANRINDRLILLRASTNKNNVLVLDYYLPMLGGSLTPKALVAAFRAFSGLVSDIGPFDEEDIIR